ncbi:MAG: cytochrome P460 family protein, partial [Steroidobacteraceae bacterium]|nr:cytochrome P460 family protein [Steroidobacteraceae bacterium]MDW8259868.1 cytochrome P460 family protein [Gammaproteobacteria bacterium]
KSMIIEPGHPLAGLVQGLHHIYANKAAMQGYRRRPFPEGSVIVFDLLEPVAADKAITEGARKAVIVMEKNRRKFAATGGWGYEVFAGNSRTERQVGAKATEACFGCHAAQRERDYVFSDWRN